MLVVPPLLTLMPMIWPEPAPVIEFKPYIVSMLLTHSWACIFQLAKTSKTARKHLFIIWVCSDSSLFSRLLDDYFLVYPYTAALYLHIIDSFTYRAGQLQGDDRISLVIQYDRWCIDH